MKFFSCAMDKYSLSFLLIIISTGAGIEFFGSFQPVRLLLLFFSAWYFQAILKEKFNIKTDYPVLIGLGVFIIWIIYGLISLFWSPAPITGLKSELIVMSIGFISLPLCYFLSRKINDPFSLLRKSWLICFLLTSVIGLGEIILNKHFPSSCPVRIVDGHITPHASATFGNYNNYCAFITFIIPYLLWGILETAKTKNKIIFLATLVLALFFIIINSCRMGYLVAGFFICYFLFVSIRNLRKKWIFGGIILLVLFIASSQINYLSTMQSRMATTFQSTDESSNQRMAMIKCGVEMLKESHGLGVGAGGFETAVKHQPSFLGEIINPHNLFVEIFAQYGILVFVIFCLWLISIFYSALKNKNISHGARKTVCSTIIALPFIGVIQSAFLGYTFLWLFLSCITTIAAYKPLNK